MSSNGPVKIRVDSALATEGAASNVATNQADLAALKAANVDGKVIYPAEARMDYLYARSGVVHGSFRSGSMMVGSGGVSISTAAEGDEPSGAAGIYLGISGGNPLFYVNDATGTSTVSFNGADGSASFKGTIAAGSTVSATMTAGAIYVGSGGVTISNDAAANNGVVINANQIRTIVGGVPTITIDGATGIITAGKFALTADAGSSLDLSLGTHIFATAITVGAAGRTMANLARTFYQTTAPTTGMLTGDIWIDSDDPNLTTWRYNGSNWTTQTVGTVNHTYYQTTAPSSGMVTGDLWYDSDDNVMYRYSGANWTTQGVGTINHTYAQTAEPSSGMVAGDIWIDTNDGNKMYRYSGSSWVAVLDAILTGGYVTVDSNNNITNIDTTGITVGTATSGARVQINSTGVGVYNSGGTLLTYMDTNGFHCKRTNVANPAAAERVSLLSYNAVENAAIWARKDDNAGVSIASFSGDMVLYSGLALSDFTTFTDKTIQLSSGGLIILYPGLSGSNAKVQVPAGTRIEFTSGGPTISSGTAPSQGAAATGYVIGSIYLATGGSLWLVDSAGNWDRIYGKSATAATAHS